MKIIEEAATKQYKKDKGSFRVDCYIEQEVFGVNSIYPRSHTPLYHLTVTFQSGVFGLGEARFDFIEASENTLYRIAIASIKAWADEYFRESEPVT